MSDQKSREPLTEEERAKFERYAGEIFSRGVAVYIEAEHFCTQARGVRDLSSRTGTLVMRGAYNENPLLSEEFRLMIDRRTGAPGHGA